MADDVNPCPCWWVAAAIHDGHCCMTTENREAGCHREMAAREGEGGHLMAAESAETERVRAAGRVETMARFLCEHDHGGDTDWPRSHDDSSRRRRWFYRALARDVLEKVAEMGAEFGSSCSHPDHLDALYTAVACPGCQGADSGREDGA